MQNKRIILLLDMDVFNSMEIVSGIEKYIANLDWDIFPIFYDNINVLSKIIKEEKIDGIIGSFANGHILDLKDCKMPIVNISSISQIRNMSSVLNDHYKAGVQAAEHFYKNNLKNLYFCGQRTLNYSEIMRNGYTEFSSQNKLIVSETPSFFMDNNSDLVRSWLQKIKKPCGVFCTNNIIARNIIHTANKMHLNIPDDISIVVWNSSKLDSLISGIELSTISPNGYEQGQQAAGMLNRLFQDNSKTLIKHITPKQVEIGLSSSFIAGKHPKYAQAYTYILNNFHTHINIEELAKKIGVSRRKLELIFQDESNMSPYQTIIHERIKKAKQLLQDSNLKIVDIAEMCGFTEQRQLSVTFKKATGLSPKYFRNKND